MCDFRSRALDTWREPNSKHCEKNKEHKMHKHLVWTNGNNFVCLFTWSSSLHRLRCITLMMPQTCNWRTRLRLLCLRIVNWIVIECERMVRTWRNVNMLSGYAPSIVPTQTILQSSWAMQSASECPYVTAAKLVDNFYTSKNKRIQWMSDHTNKLNYKLETIIIHGRNR